MEKGNALEFAVRAIEASILRSSPNLKKNTFTIENKKHVTVEGVRHEVDVYVDLGKGYRTTFIFECKNWEAAVGKNEIIIFSEKIDATQAQTGFFVAKSYTKDADAQAAKDPRVSLLIATEYNAEETPIPFDFHFISRGQTKADVEFFSRNKSSSPQSRPLRIGAARATMNGNGLNIDEYVQKWIGKTCDKNLLTFPSGTLTEDVYQREAEAERVFDEGELLLNDVDIATIKLRIKFSVLVIRPPVISHFDVATRGRSISLASVEIGGGTYQAAFTVR